MKYLLVALLGLMLSCGTQEVREVEKIVEVPIPTQPPDREPPPLGPINPDFMDFQLEVQLALNDINTLSESERLMTRYVSTSNFFNGGEKDLELKRAGINKMINMISTERLLAFGTPVGPSETLIRINLDDFGATRQLWREFEKENIIGFIPQDTRGITLRYLTQTNQPIVFATSMALSILGGDILTHDNGLYYKFLRQPPELNDFFASIGIDLQEEVDDIEYHCAGGGNSRIALSKHRLVCVLDTAAAGFLLTTYDTDLSDPDNLFANPFTFEIANAQNIKRSERIFGAVAQEHIYSLQNGLLVGYRLNNTINGRAETIAPASVVNDTEAVAFQLPPDILIGSCAGCHHTNAAIAFEDSVARAIERSGAFSAAEKELGRTYYRNDAFQAILASANRQHSQSLAELGVSTLDQDPVTRELSWTLRGELDVKTVAGYTYLTEDEFLRRLDGTNNSKLIFGALLDGGTVQLKDLADNYDLLIEELLLFRDENDL